jgi:antitoxin (DNA-binding transcriptional repressor) of toxin-antitoxin stability system
MTVLPAPETVSVTEASERGVSAIVRAAGEGHDIVVERHGKAIAAVVGMRRLGELAELEADLRSAALVLTRLATDDGRRTDLDDVIAALGFDRAELEAELDADLAAGRS